MFDSSEPAALVFPGQGAHCPECSIRSASAGFSEHHARVSALLGRDPLADPGR